MPSIEYDGDLGQYAADASGSVDVSGVTVHDVVALALVILVVAVVFHLRIKIIGVFERFRNRKHRNYVSLDGSFQQDIESGLSSNTFDLQAHNQHDARKGLSEADKAEVLRLMEQHQLSFDDARLRFVKAKFGDNNIGPDGYPLDPKTVTF